MRCLYILIDSSTRPRSAKNRYGKSTAFWCAFWNEIKGMPCRAGIVYNATDGPMKIFYDGIIRALEVCFPIVGVNRTVKVMGDCQHVIKQLRGEIKSIELENYFNQVRRLEFKYRVYKKGTISFEYIPRDNDFYKKVHRCAKDFLEFLKKRFHQK